MSTAELDPISRACRLLREGAAELKNCHTPAATGHDWTGEPEAKAAYDEHMATADALERWADSIGAGGVESLRGRQCLHRISEPAGEYPALPDADRDYMRKVVAVAVTMLFDGYKEDVTRVFSTGELSEFVTITAAMGGERVEDIYRRAWDLLSLPVRASHGQAPASRKPKADSVDYFTEWAVTLWKGRERIRKELRASHGQAQAAPQTSPASQGDALDAARYRYLRDGDWREHEKLESVIRLQLNTLWDETIDAARAAQKGGA